MPELAAVLAYVTGGPATGEALVRAVDAVCFTGSVKTGRRVGLAAMEAFIPSFLELGGKDAALVLADADLHRTARSLAWGGMVGAGQSCMSIECVYVDATVAQPFTDLLVQREAALRHNWSDIHQGQIGPIIAAAQVDVVRRHLEQAQAAGARALTGGHVVQHGGGWWCEPTALVHDGAKQSFKLSGLGGSRMGPGSRARFYRQQALLINEAAAAPWWF